MAELEKEPLPRSLKGVALRQAENVNKVMIEMSKDLGKVSKDIKKESDLQSASSEISAIVNENINTVGGIIYDGSISAREISIESDIKITSTTLLPKVDYDAFKKYVQDGRKLISLSVFEYMNKRSYVDGRTMKYRLTTIKEGTSNVVEAIISNGIRDGKGPFQVAKEIDQYIRNDGRSKWVSPWSIKRREKGFPITSSYKGGVPAGSVKYNSLRIARTELINNYRWARIESTKTQDWVIGWKWNLSGAHKEVDQCDTWASHDEGLGQGVYSKASDILSLGHPHCFCQVETITLFMQKYARYFDEAEKRGLISPKKYSIPDSK